MKCWILYQNQGLWDELDALNTTVNCSCACQYGGKTNMVKSLQDERLIQFLMDFNDTYIAVKSNIIMMSPLPNMNYAYALLIQDDKHREVYVNLQFSRYSTFFLAVNQNNFS